MESRPETLLAGNAVDFEELRQMPHCNVYEVAKVLNSPTARVLCGRRYSRVICVSKKGLMVVLKRGTNDVCTFKWARECKDIQQVYRMLKSPDSSGVRPAQLTVQFFPTSLARCFSDVFVMEDRVAKDFCEDVGRHMNGGGHIKTMPWGNTDSRSLGGERSTVASARSSSTPVSNHRARSLSASGRPVVHAVPVDVGPVPSGLSPALVAVIAQKRKESLLLKESQEAHRLLARNAEASPSQASTVPPDISEATDLISLDDDPFGDLVRSRSLPGPSATVYTNEMAQANFVGSTGSETSTESAIQDPFAFLFEESTVVTSSSEGSQVQPMVAPSSLILDDSEQRRRSVSVALVNNAFEQHSSARSSSVIEEERKQRLSRNSLVNIQQVDVFSDIQWKA